MYFVVVFTVLRKDGSDGGDEGGFVSGSGSDDEVTLVNGEAEKSDDEKFVATEDDVD